MLRAFDCDYLRSRMISAILKDKMQNRKGIIRYELFKDLSGGINCADPERFDYHTNIFNSQGFFESKRIQTKLGGISCELVVMRHLDENKYFGQLDGLLGDYLQAGCELCYYEVNLDSINL